jgi:hypothetical protein
MRDDICDLDLIYAAGYLDGEGCFTVTNGHKCVVACATTHKPTILWLHKLFGGCLSLNNTVRKPHHRPTHRWQVVCKDAARVCKLLTPYLKEKAPQALLLILLDHTMGAPGKHIHPDVYAERVMLAKFLKDKKHEIYT